MTLLVSIAVLLGPTAAPTQKDHTGVERIKEAITWSFCGHHYRKCEDGETAKRIAWCESRYNRYAQNGQYLGLFQMGSNERYIYGHGWTAWLQAKAANAYQNVSGWGPWNASRVCWG